MAVGREATVRYAILGPIGLSDGERLVPAGGARQVALLAFLLVHANQAVSNDRLIDALFAQRSPTSGLKSLHVAISRLRKTLDAGGIAGGPALCTVAGGYLLVVRPGELDAEVFQTLMQDGRRALEAGEAKTARNLLGEAVRMWRGPALAEVAYEDWAQPEIRRLEELRLTGLEARVEAALGQGEHGAAVAELESLVAAHPGRERLVGQLMLALYRCGRQGEALGVYARARAYLSAELGIEPGPGLRALQAEIFAQAPALQHTVDEHVSVAAAGASPAAQAHVASVPVGLSLPRSLQVPANSPFVGRARELKRLRERWTDVCAGTRSAVVIGGEAGIGKTRLAIELAAAVHERGALVLYGRCDEGLAVPYQPFVEALRPYARAVGLDRLRAELGDLAAELGRLLPELASLGEPMRADPESERFALFEAVAALLEAATREQPSLLLVDDLHWAAHPTLLLLRHLIRSERTLNMLLLGTYRETELNSNDQLAQLLADLHRDASVQLVSIRGLDVDAIATLLQAGDDSDLRERAHEFANLLFTETAGNPFFLRELLADVSESGAISTVDKRSRAGITAMPLTIPQGLRHVINQRVTRLPAATGRALRVAAVAGSTFGFGLIERVLDDAYVLDALDEAVAAGLLTEAGDGVYVFAHALVRQTLYTELGSARRIRLHRQLGEALETLDDAQFDVEALAYHFAQAAADGQGVKAARYARAAGRSATTRLGYEEAAAHCERGLEALALSDDTQEQLRCELLLALGEARWGAGELDKARQACKQAAEVADSLGDSTALARAALGFCGPYRVEVASAVTRPVADLLQRALAALGAEDSALRAQLMGRLAAYTDVEARRAVLARQALAMARRVADKATLADVLANSHWATSGPDSLRESIAVTQELACVAHEVGDRRLRVRAHGRLAGDLLELGDFAAVERELNELRRLCEPRRERYFAWVLAMVRAHYAYLGGRLDYCETLTNDAFVQRHEGHDETASHAFTVQMYFIRREQGRLDEVAETIEAVVVQYPRLAVWRCGLAYLYAELERIPEARRELDALARNDFSDLSRDTFWLANLSMLSEVVVLVDDARRAQLLYELLLPYADRCAVVIGLLCQGSVSRPLGLVATMLLRYDDAARHFEQALEMNTQIRSPLWVAHTQHDYARMLLARNERGDIDRALQLLDQAFATAKELGLKALADKAAPLKFAPEAVRRSSAVRRV